MDEVRIGIIGIGGMGSNHARKIHAGDGGRTRLTAVCDTDPKRLEWAADALGDVKRFARPEELLDSGEIDAVLIATPHYDHPPIARAAFQRGLHVLTEKPAGVYTKQVREMNEVAEASGKVFAIMFQQRTQAAHRKLKQLIDDGQLGEVKRIVWIITAWYRTQFYYDRGGWRASWSGEGGGVLMNQCPHNLDLWQWWFGLPTRLRASCYYGKDHDIEVEDDVTAFMEYDNGATGTFITTTSTAPGTNRLEINADRGKVVLEDGQITFWRTVRPVSEDIKTSTQAFAKPETWRCEIPIGHDGGGHMGIVRNFADAILDGAELTAPGTEGIKGLSLGNAMNLSSWQDDGWVDLPVDEDLFHGMLQERIKTSTYQKNTVESDDTDLSGSFL
jgi:predicted dehydrogenase